VTPFEVWYGRPLTQQNLSLALSLSFAFTPVIKEDKDDKFKLEKEAEEDNTQEYLFTKLHKRVFAHNALEAVKYAKRGGKQTTYKLKQIVLLAIPHKNRLTVKASRLPT
jgi:hypothetical protein